MGLKFGTTVFKFIAAVLGVILCAIIIGRAGSDMGTEESLDAFGGALSGAVILTYILGILCAGGALLFALYRIIVNPRKNIALVIGVVGMLLIWLIAYFALSDTWLPKNSIETAGVAKWSSAGLMTLYIVGFLTIASLIYVEVNKLLK